MWASDMSLTRATSFFIRSSSLASQKSDFLLTLPFSKGFTMTDRVRRNGQLSSCEPCRKSKLRCDHNRPICGRCVRRRLSQQQCHYHPAPMAAPKPRQMTAKQLTSRQFSAQSETVSPHRQLISGSTTASSHTSPQTEDSRPYEPINMSSNLMCFADRNNSHSQRTYTSLTRIGVALPQPSQPSPRAISEGAQLLNDILDLAVELGEPLSNFSLDKVQLCIHGPLIETAWNVTSKSMQSLLNNRANIDLDSISRAIFERTSIPPVFPPTAADGALELALSTQSLRWEMIGIYCAQIGVYLGGELDKSFSLTAHQKWTSGRKTLMHKAFRATIQCESFCDQLGSINDLYLWFLMLNNLYATWCFGDDSYHVLRLGGSMTSVFLALGFHKGANTDSSMPFYMVEIRKRVIAWAHDHDKVLASFTSR